MLTGDFVFVGDVGRPDLLDEAAGGVDTRFEGAHQLFASLRDRFLTLPDYVQVLPAHGAGSACGKSLGAIAATTVGYERAFSWWETYLAADDEQGFVDELLSGQPDAHASPARMKSQNRTGPAVLHPAHRSPSGPLRRCSTSWSAPRDPGGPRDRRRVRRHRGRFPQHPGRSEAATCGARGSTIRRRSTGRSFSSRTTARRQNWMRDHLVRVGIDAVDGFIRSSTGSSWCSPDCCSRELDGLADVNLVDVRGSSEHADGHIPGSAHLSGGRAAVAPRPSCPRTAPS